MLTVADYSDRMSLRLFGLSAALVACLPVVPAALLEGSNAAQAPARSIAGLLDTLDRVRAFHETAISPDGRRVAWVEDVSVADGTTAIYLRTIGAPLSETTCPGWRLAPKSTASSAKRARVTSSMARRA